MTAQEHFMARCLQLAKKGINHVAPNPMVGCVITIPDENCDFGQRIIGEGYHQMHGESHAEVNAIQSVKNKFLLKEAWLYVSLEPCNHYGKTPPCAHLIVESGIKKVIVGAPDPNPLVSGKGIIFLMEKGVDVVAGILNDACNELNKCFNTYYKKQRPYIILKWAQTSQKHISDSNFNSKWISNPSSRQLVHKWRSEAQAIMVGTNTAIYDNPSLTTRLWAGSSPLRVVIDKQLKIPTNHHLFNAQEPTLVFNQLKDYKSENLAFIQLKDFTLKGIIDELYSRKINSLFVEGGAKLIQSFIDNNLWDEARIFTGNKIFEEGIEAPVLSGIQEKEEFILNDKLQIIKNIA